MRAIFGSDNNICLFTGRICGEDGKHVGDACKRNQRICEKWQLKYLAVNFLFLRHSFLLFFWYLAGIFK